MYGKKLLYGLVGSFILSVLVSPAAAVTDQIYWPGTTYNVNTNTYLGLVSNQTNDYIFGVREDGGIDEMYWSTAVYITRSVTNTAYKKIAADKVNVDDIYAAKADGSGLDSIYYSSGWQTESMNTTDYDMLTTNVVTDYIFGLRASDGGIDEIYYSGGWVTNSVTGTAYDFIEHDRITADRIYAVKANGSGLDYIYYSGGWQTQNINTTDYVMLAANKCSDYIFGLRASDGGIDEIYYSGGWQTHSVTDTAYKSIATDNINTDVIYAARADGNGLDDIYWSGAWITVSLSSTDYDILVADGGATDVVFGTGPTVKANNPIPKDGGAASPYVTLQWTAGVGASSHDVYFGTSYSAVADANTSSPEFKGNQTETSYDPPETLSTGITYYWRIDEQDTYYKGPVWSFTIGELIAHWKMDEGVGTTAYDTSGYGTAADAAFAGDPCWVAGYTGEAGDYALDFNGVADYLDCTFSSKFNLTEDQVSIAAWVDQGTGGTMFQDILAFMDVGYSLYTRTGMPTMSIGSDYARWASSIVDSGWHHLVGVVDGTHVRIFVDGEERNSAARTQTLETPSALYIGGVVAWNDYFDGVIDDVRVYNYGLDPVEVFNLYDPEGNEWICTSPPLMDFNDDCVVDMKDLAEFCLGWLECGRWPEEWCL